MKNYERKILLFLVLLALLTVGFVFFSINKNSDRVIKSSGSRETPFTQPTGHGGPCDDATYYKDHMEACAIQ